MEIPGALFSTKNTVQITTYRNMIGIPGNLTDVVPVVYQVGQPDVQLPGIANRVDKSHIHCPAIEHSSNNSIPLYETFNLIITELSLVGNNFPHIVVTRPYRSLVQFHDLIKSFIGQMRHTQNNLITPTYPTIHLPNQLRTKARYSSF